ncbi:isoprenylcysteine carboxylmethyltransferase family protein [Melioribacteraceae bacterium 4301-Me]|uniref:methyltransferase family protein n=1 Tax=Pyranulibacter aquaticus TaxID=3163344 RepID=UPI0035989748
MEPINILTALGVFLSMAANWSGTKKGLKTSITKVQERPDSFLQKLPPNVSVIILLFIFFGIFNIGVLPTEIKNNYNNLRIGGLIIFYLFSWLQVVSFRSLGSFYTQEIVILKRHELCTSGIYKTIRHPQYLSQILSDLGAGIALMSYLVIPLTLLAELPLFIMRAKLEEKLLSKHFNEKYNLYKKQSGFFIPFIG